MCNQKDQFDWYVSNKKSQAIIELIKKYKKIGYVSTLAGQVTSCNQVDGSFNVARFNFIEGLYFDPTKNQLLISDYLNNRFKVLDFSCLSLPSSLSRILHS